MPLSNITMTWQFKEMITEKYHCSCNVELFYKILQNILGIHVFFLKNLFVFNSVS